MVILSPKRAILQNSSPEFSKTVIWSQKRQHYINHSLIPLKRLFVPKKGQHYRNHSIKPLKRLFGPKKGIISKINDFKLEFQCKIGLICSEDSYTWISMKSRSDVQWRLIYLNMNETSAWCAVKTRVLEYH